MDFKIGQTVKLVDNRGMAASVGATAVVTRRTYEFYGMEVIDVVWKTRFNKQENGCYSTHHFKSILKEGQQLLFSFMGE